MNMILVKRNQLNGGRAGVCSEGEREICKEKHSLAEPEVTYGRVSDRKLPYKEGYFGA